MKANRYRRQCRVFHTSTLSTTTIFSYNLVLPYLATVKNPGSTDGVEAR